MAFGESKPLIVGSSSIQPKKKLSLEENDDDDSDSYVDLNKSKQEQGKCQCKWNKKFLWSIPLLLLFLSMVVIWMYHHHLSNNTVSPSVRMRKPTGPYKLLEAHYGNNFFDYYDFYNGPDSLGSAGYNVYVDKDRAFQMNLANVTTTTTTTSNTTSGDLDGKEESFIFLQSIPEQDSTNGNGFRESVRLEGKRRFNRGLFILDVAHMPAGCGVWPAFWMTDEDAWPDNGEIDIVEGINTQSVVKTALHTSDRCSMYAQVPPWTKTGVWDTSTGLPDTYTGIPNYIDRLEADNCWVMAPHQWANQGCVAVSTENGTIGQPMNDIGGGVYVLEWDPANRYIKSWVFKNGNVPENLEGAIATASNDNNINKKDTIIPTPEKWPLPYAYFAIGEYSSCSSDHFQNMRLIFNLAFCGTVAGNRFFKDCPALSQQYNVHNDSVLTCNAYIASEPDALSEAYWKIRGVYVYEREYESQSSR